MRKLALAAAIAALTPALASAATPSVEEMWEIIQKQQAEIERLKAQNSVTATKLEETDIKIEATAEAVEQGSNNKLLEWAEKTKLGGYGEHHFNHKKDGDDKVDAHRFVLFIGHEFNEKVRFFSELEVEHGFAVDTADGSGPGKVELEQAYIEWDFADKHSLTIGQFLVPAGIINETHEPDTFYGVERNRIEYNIVPATWWETGVMLGGELAPGLSYNAAVHSGLETTAAGKEFNIRSGRQKSAKATAEDLAATLRLKYTGIQGLELGATAHHQQDLTQGDDALDGSEALLLEAHARAKFGDLTLTGLYAQWDIDGEDAKAVGKDKQDGHFVEASYMVTPKLGVFLRRSQWDTSAGSSAATETEAWEYGLNYWLTDTVVLKADITDQTDYKAEDSVNFGVGWSY